MRVLLVKMSSLGDVVHTLPAVSDAAAALGPALELDWVVEEAFAAIPARHPAVSAVIPVAWRRWRRNLGGSRGEMRAFLRRLREHRYDLVLDAQGLVKSAAVTALARGGTRVGLARGSAREGAAALVYRRPVAVPRGQHAIDRLRALFAAAFDYPRPEGLLDYGIVEAASGRGVGDPESRPAAAPTGPAARRCVLLHGTTWESKLWPERFWLDLAGRAAAAGFRVELPWGDEDEHRRAEHIAAGGHAEVLPRLGLGEVIERLAGAALVVGVDSGLSHLAAALEVPTVVVYGPTDSVLTGVRGRRARSLQSTLPGAPCFVRVCSWRGPPQCWQGEPVMPACYASVAPDRVWAAATELLDAPRVQHL